jgi:hypothetical protein
MGKIANPFFFNLGRLTYFLKESYNNIFLESGKQLLHGTIGFLNI